MSRLSASSRAGLAGIAIVGAFAIIELTALSEWLTVAGRVALLAVAPLTLVALLAFGVWTGFRYVRDRQWQD